MPSRYRRSTNPGYLFSVRFDTVHGHDYRKVRAWSQKEALDIATRQWPHASNLEIDHRL